MRCARICRLGIVAAQGYDGLKMLLAIIADGSDGRLPENAPAAYLHSVILNGCCNARYSSQVTAIRG